MRSTFRHPSDQELTICLDQLEREDLWIREKLVLPSKPKVIGWDELRDTGPEDWIGCRRSPDDSDWLILLRGMLWEELRDSLPWDAPLLLSPALNYRDVWGDREHGELRRHHRHAVLAQYFRITKVDSLPGIVLLQMNDWCLREDVEGNYLFRNRDAMDGLLCDLLKQYASDKEDETIVRRVFKNKIKNLKRGKISDPNYESPVESTMLTGWFRHGLFMAKDKEIAEAISARRKLNVTPNAVKLARRRLKLVKKKSCS